MSFISSILNYLIFGLDPVTQYRRYVQAIHRFGLSSVGDKWVSEL
jgi:hypothetical protein